MSLKGGVRALQEVPALPSVALLPELAIDPAPEIQGLGGGHQGLGQEPTHLGVEVVMQCTESSTQYS